MRSIEYTSLSPFSEEITKHALYVEGRRLFEVRDGKMMFSDLRFGEATDCYVVPIPETNNCLIRVRHKGEPDDYGLTVGAADVDRVFRFLMAAHVGDMDLTSALFDLLLLEPTETSAS